MKVQDIINEVWDDDEDQRQFENPIPPASQDAFAYMDDIDGTLTDLYKQEHGIEKLERAEYTKSIHVQREKYGEIVDVPLDRILSTETHLDKKHIDALTKGTDVKISSVYPVLYKKGNVYFVGDGNHRVAVEQMKGGKSIRAIVLDGATILNNKE
jgi:hypothetical protein